MHNHFPYPLYLVILEAACIHQPYLAVLEAALLGGVDIVQLREKDVSTEVFMQKAFAVKKLTDRYQVPLIINDNLEVAKRINAFGIHVGNNDVSPSLIRDQWPTCKCIGYSVESLDQVDNDAAKSADYLGMSPIFSTATKTDTITEWGIDGIRTISTLTDKPLIAIGNMQLHNIASVIKAGADSIAVVSAICSSQHPEQTAQQLKLLINNTKNETV